MKQNLIYLNKYQVALTLNLANNSVTGDNTFTFRLEDIGDEPSDDNTVTVTTDTLDVVADFTSNPNEVEVTVNNFSLLEGKYQYFVKVKNIYAIDSEVLVSLNVIDDEGAIPESEYQYKLKYFIERPSYTCNIYERTFLEVTPTEIEGRAEVTYQERKDLLDPIISKSLKLRLSASVDLDLQDLYSEDEKTYKVEIIKGGDIDFVGFILPDGIWEDYVADKWELSINATDGLAGLKNVSFSNENKQNFRNKMTAMNIIHTCLKKTGLNLPILANCQVSYSDNEAISKQILSNIFLSVERYTQDNNEPMDCESVLKSILQCLNLTLVQNRDYWMLYKTTDMIERVFMSRYVDGLFVESFFTNFGHEIGSHINNFELFHCNSNQKKSIAPSVQAYQITYEYGVSKNVLSNGGLFHTGEGINIEGWNVYTSPDGLVYRGYDEGLDYVIRGVVKKFTSSFPIMLELDQTVTIPANSNITMTVEFANRGIDSEFLIFTLGVNDGTNIYWFDKTNGEWSTTIKYNHVFNARLYLADPNTLPPTYGRVGLGDARFQLEAQVPFDGEIVLRFHRRSIHNTTDSVIAIKSVSFSASANNIKSKSYTARRNKNISTSVKSNVTVYNGDSESDLFVGTIFEYDSDTPTDKWHRFAFVGDNLVAIDERKELLEITAEENLMMSPRPMTIFEGDIKGYVPYVTFFTIDGLAGKKFQFLRYSYSYDDDIVRMTAKEFNRQIPFSDFNVKITENFGNEAKVTILT